MKKKQGECGEEARRMWGRSKENVGKKQVDCREKARRMRERKANVWERRGRDQVTKITGEKWDSTILSFRSD